jgi:hypothetical protein
MLCLLTALAASAPALADSVGVSVRVGQPGFYGRIDVGTLPAPPTLYAEPIVVAPGAVGVVREPIYLRVPPGHAKHWSKHCHRYDACGRPVYFVQERWYNEVYVPRYAHEARVVETVPAYAYAERRPRPRLYSVPVTSVRAVVGPPEQRCWVERRQVVEATSTFPVRSPAPSSEASSATRSAADAVATSRRSEVRSRAARSGRTSGAAGRS